MASAKHSKIDIESEGTVLNLRRLQNRKIFVTSERSSAHSINPIMATFLKNFMVGTGQAKGLLTNILLVVLVC